MHPATGTASENADWTVESADPGEPEAAAVLRDYLAEMISRYYGRETDDAEIDRHLRAGHDSDDLAEPTGVLLLARRSGTVVGCVGLRRVDGDTGGDTLELTRMFVRREARGEGGAALLLTAAESRARGLGARSIRLNTRSDLVEARSLYAKHGYVEVPAFGEDPFADHWFAKPLSGHPAPR